MTTGSSFAARPTEETRLTSQSGSSKDGIGNTFYCSFGGDQDENDELDLTESKSTNRSMLDKSCGSSSMMDFILKDTDDGDGKLLTNGK